MVVVVTEPMGVAVTVAGPMIIRLMVVVAVVVVVVVAVAVAAHAAGARAPSGHLSCGAGPAQRGS